MANLIQIKRAITATTPTSLANGELAYSGNTQSDSLFIGNPNGGSVTRIGGSKFGYVYNSTPGTLTSNAAVITDSSGFVNTLKVGNTTINAVVNSTSVALSNSTAAIVISIPSAAVISNGQYYLNANGSYALVDTSAATAGSNTQIFFNDSGFINASSGFVFNKASNNLTVANTITVGSGTINTTIYTGKAYTANDASYLNGNTAADLQTYADNKAANAYSNATSYADNKAANAYSNATSYADNKAANAYSNAMADTLSRNGSYTGNNTFGGTNTVFSSNVVITGDVTSENITPSANVTYSLGTNGLRWNEVHAANVHSVNGYFDGSVSIAGNLTVSGNVVTTNVQSVIVSDPLIYLAGNNYTSDLVDIGFAGNYNDGTNRHTGLFRDASDGEYKLFSGLTQELDSALTVNTADPTFAIATLNSYLKSGGFSTNATVVSITANSTVNVAIVANSITISTPLAGTSGGTGLATVTSQDILVGNTSNGYSKLSLGTDGYVLQSNGSALVYASLDGGTF